MSFSGTFAEDDHRLPHPAESAVPHRVSGRNKRRRTPALFKLVLAGFLRAGHARPLQDVSFCVCSPPPRTLEFVSSEGWFPASLESANRTPHQVAIGFRRRLSAGRVRRAWRRAPFRNLAASCPELGLLAAFRWVLESWPSPLAHANPADL